MPDLDLTDFTPQPDLARAHTMPSRWYTDPAFYALEREKIFARCWAAVARLDQLANPGDFVATAIAEEPVVVLRDDKGELRAFSNVCRHRARVVMSGTGKCKAMQCKYHGFTYGLDGALRGTPDFDGVKDWQKADFNLPKLRVEAWGPFVFVCIDPDAAPLRDWLGDMPERMAAMNVPFESMQFVERREYEVECNWKVFVDNYQEGYHVPVAHPGLMTELDYGQYTIETAPFGTLQHAPIRGGEGDRRYQAGAEARALYYWMAPNFMVNVYPDNLDTNLVIPLGHDRCRVVMEWYAHDPVAFRPTFEARGLAFSEQVQFEDMEICASVQLGLNSRFYDRGRYSVKQEAAVHHFHRLVHALLTGAPCASGGPIAAMPATAGSIT